MNKAMLWGIGGPDGEDFDRVQLPVGEDILHKSRGQIDIRQEVWNDGKPGACTGQPIESLRVIGKDPGLRLDASPVSARFAECDGRAVHWRECQPIPASKVFGIIRIW